MRKLLILACLALLVASCQESLEERAVRECKEFTQRMCPTPVVNNTRTDSVTFDKATKTYTYHCLFLNALDDSTAINRVKGQLHDGLKKGIIEDTHTKAYKEAGFNFEYICRSAKNPNIILYRDLFKSSEINKKANKKELFESQKVYLNQATRDSVYIAMKGNFLIKKDEFSSTGDSWVIPKTKPKYRNQNALYCYFLIRNDKSVYNLRFVLQYEAEKWLFIQNCIFNIDGNNITYSPSNMERDNNSRIWEWFDELVDDHNISIIRQIANAKNVKIKFVGRQYSDVRTVKATDIASIKEVLDFYEALGGTY